MHDLLYYKKEKDFSQNSDNPKDNRNLKIFSWPGLGLPGRRPKFSYQNFNPYKSICSKTRVKVVKVPLVINASHCAKNITPLENKDIFGFEHRVELK